MRCHIDVETYSELDLKTVGAHVYAAHASTDALCVCWAIEDGPVQTWRAGDPPPAAADLPVAAEWWAYNVAFDSLIWFHVLHQRYGWPWPGWDRFRCSMAAAAYGNLPGALGEVAKALGTSGKNADGQRLMLTLCRPAAPTKASADPKRRHTAEALKKLAEYCAQDVEAERALHQRLPTLPPSELRLWQLDQTINRRGVYIDAELVGRLQRAAGALRERLREELAELTGGAVERETQLPALTAWCCARGLVAPKGRGAMDAEAIDRYLELDGLDAGVRRALEIRRELGKSSLAKLDRMLDCRGADGRLRGALQYYGAHQTGRWAGRLIQPQNFPRGVLSSPGEYQLAMNVVREADTQRAPEYLTACYGTQTTDVLASLLRPCIRAAPGKLLLVVDASAIEARGLAWVAQEGWRLDVFRKGGKIYEASAARTLGVPVSSITKGSKERGLGKLTELALGYQGGVQALIRFGAVLRYGLTEAQLPPLIEAWRKASPAIVAFWRNVQAAAINAVQSPGDLMGVGPVTLVCRDGHLRLRLPSGRELWYRDAHVRHEPAPWDADKLLPKLYFHGEDAQGRWGLQTAYGGSLTNNIVQAVCRDVLAEAMLRAEAAGFPVVLTVHDEIVAEVDDPGSDERRDALVLRLESALSMAPKWAHDLPLAAEGFSCDFYHK
jgi:DNA polymerase bacteriophage-type